MVKSSLLDTEIAQALAKSSSGRRGILSGIGRIAGRKIAYVRRPDGSLSDYTLSEFRRIFGVPALSLPDQAAVTEIGS